MWFLWLVRLEKTREELKCESMSQLYALGHSSLCSEAFDELIWENVKWRGTTAFQFRFTNASVQVLQVRANPVVPSRVLESSRLLWKPTIHLSPMRIQMYVSLFQITLMRVGNLCVCMCPLYALFHREKSVIYKPWKITRKAVVVYSSLPIKFKWLLHGLPTLGLSEDTFYKCAPMYCILCAEKCGTSV